MNEQPINTKLRTALWVLGAVLLILAFYYAYSTLLKGPSSDTPQVTVGSEESPDFRTSLQLAVAGVDQKPLQNFFVEKAAKGEKDAEAKSAIYWLTHRYFDNGGDIYEIYDFIEAHPEVAFLKEAEKREPAIFQRVKAHENIIPFGGDSLAALLTYYDIIDENGYGDIALWGLAANKYSEIMLSKYRAHFANPNKQYAENEVTLLQESSFHKAKTMNYVNRIDSYIRAHAPTSLNDLNSLDVIPDDLLVGLNQYMASIMHLKAVGDVVLTPYPMDALYEYNITLAETKVPRLYFFSNYLYAISLVHSGGATAENVAKPVKRMLDFNTKIGEGEWGASTYRVLRANQTRYAEGMYSYTAVAKLAQLSPDFKAWLLANKWTEADFK